MSTIQGTTFHPYAPGVWVPWQARAVTLRRYPVIAVVTNFLSCAAAMQEAPWGNTTFYFPNQTNPGLNSTAAMISASKRALRGLFGLGGC